MDPSGFRSLALPELPMEECNSKWLPFPARANLQAGSLRQTASNWTSELKISAWTWNLPQGQQHISNAAAGEGWHLGGQQGDGPPWRADCPPTICWNTSDLSHFMPFDLPSWQWWGRIKACNLKGERWQETLWKWDPFVLLIVLLQLGIKWKQWHGDYYKSRLNRCAASL